MSGLKEQSMIDWKKIVNLDGTKLKNIFIYYRLIENEVSVSLGKYSYP